MDSENGSGAAGPTRVIYSVYESIKAKSFTPTDKTFSMSQFQNLKAPIQGLNVGKNKDTCVCVFVCMRVCVCVWAALQAKDNSQRSSMMFLI